MMDGQVITALQNGTAFFASTSLIAIGGSLTCFTRPRDVDGRRRIGHLAARHPRSVELKVVG